MIDKTYFDEDTLFKVNLALKDSGLTLDQARDAITEMQNAGILFRERFYGSLVLEDLENLLDLLARYRDRVIIEYPQGQKYAIGHLNLYGIRTEDPAVVIKIRSI